MQKHLVCFPFKIEINLFKLILIYIIRFLNQFIFIVKNGTIELFKKFLLFFSFLSLFFTPKDYFKWNQKQIFPKLGKHLFMLAFAVL